MVGIAALDPDARLIRSDDPGLAQRRDGPVALGRKGALRSMFISPPWLTVSPNRSAKGLCSRS
jgi:hypothetical protein